MLHVVGGVEGFALRRLGPVVRVWLGESVALVAVSLALGHLHVRLLNLVRCHVPLLVLHRHVRVLE